MMDTGFFKWVWRLNAILLAGLLVTAAALLAWEARPKGSRSAVDVINIDPADETLVEDFVVGATRMIDGGNMLRYGVGREQEYDTGYSSSKSTRRNTINYAYMSTETGERRWLLDDFAGLISWTSDITRGGETATDSARLDGSSDDGKLIATLHLLIEDDTSEDNRLSRSDRGRLIATRPDGTGLTTLITDIDQIGSDWQLDAERQLIRFKSDDISKIAILNVRKLNIENVHELATQ